MRQLFVGSLLSIAAISGAPASALPVVGVTGVTLGVTGGTLGVGPEVSYRPNPLFGVRASATFFGVSGHGDVGDYRYDGHARLRSFGGTVDLHPLANGLRLSAGLRATDGNRVRFTGMPRDSQTYAGIVYTPAQLGALSGRIRTHDVSPLLTAGYASGGLSGFVFGIDGGVMFHGRPRVTDIVTSGQLATNPLAQAQLAAQIQRLRDRVDNYRYYPVLQLSVGYRF